LEYAGLVSMMPPDHTHAQLIIDLINTRYLGDQSDALVEAGATEWLREHLGRLRGKSSATALAPLRQLREGLRQAALANNGGQPDRTAIAEADAVLRGAPVIVRLNGGAGDATLGSTAPEGTMEHIVATVARAYLSSQLGGTWPRVKVCAEPACRWAFLDLSRNASRRWCDMSECGNRAKNRAWRDRQNRAPSGSRSRAVNRPRG
jgi:predicted RNA-binding Zn ribbon-like protein